MKTALRWLGTLFVAFSIGTVTSLAVLVGMLWWKGVLTDDRLLGMLAALQGIELPARGSAAAVDPAADEQPSLDQILQRRLVASLDLDMRETAIDKALAELRNLETQIKTENQRLDLWKLSFDRRLETLESQTTDEALLQLQRTIEAMHPKQAKDQILIILNQPPTKPDDDPMRDVVTILKTMPIDKQRKIVGEFKSPEEADKLAEILRQIRLGSPDADLIRDTRNELQEQLQTQR
jgi:flagellar motility protein MotE (MotC chaperone)